MSHKDMRMGPLLVGFLLSLTLGSGAFAQERTTSSTFPKVEKSIPDTDWVPHVGVMMGVTNPDSQARASGEIGLDVGYQPYIPFGLGVQFFTTSNNSDPKENLDRTTLLIRGTYNFGGDTPILNESYIGLGAGIVYKAEGQDAVLAPMLGFDIPIERGIKGEPFVSFGANAKYLIVDGSDTDAFSVNGVAKYWF